MTDRASSAPAAAAVAPRLPFTAWTRADDTKIVMERSAGRQFRMIAKDLGLPTDDVKRRHAELIAPRW